MKHTRKILLALLVVMTLLVGAFSITASAADTTVAVPGGHNGWDTTDYATYDSESGLYVYSVELEAKTYEFKIVENGSWLGNSGTIADTTTATSDVGWEFSSSNNSNCKLQASGGTYTFQYNAETNYLVILYTPPECDHDYVTLANGKCNLCGFGTTYTVVGSATLLGTGWDPANEDNLMTYSDGVYTKVYTNVAAGTYEHKFAANGAWSQAGEYPSSGNCPDLVVEKSGSTVTFTLDVTSGTVEYSVEIVAPAHNYVKSATTATCTESGTATYACDGSCGIENCEDCYTAEDAALGHSYAKDGVCTVDGCESQATLTVAGSLAAIFGTEWDETNTANDMTYDEETGLWSISYVNKTNAAIYPEYKIVLNHDWTVCWGGAAAEQEYDNAYVDVEAYSILTICFDLENETITTSVAACEHSYGEYTETTAPACTVAGVETASCSVCTKSDSQEIPATGHVWDNCECTACDAVLSAIEFGDYSLLTPEELAVANVAGIINVGGLKEHSGDSLQFEANSSIQFVAPENATVTITGYDTGYGIFDVYVNGEKADMAGTYSFTTTEETKVVIVPDEEKGANYAYIKSIALVQYVAPKVFENETITFGDNGNENYADSGIDFSGITLVGNNGNNSQAKQGSFNFTVAAGSLVTIHSYNGYTAYTLNDSEIITDEYYYYYAAEETTLTYVGDPESTGKNYIYSITIAPHSEHTYTDGKCVCGADEPAPEYTEMTIPEALVAKDGTKVEVSGTVCAINTAWSDNFGNISVTITDANSNTLYIYRLATNVALGDIITVQGAMDTHNSSRQIAAGATATIDGHDNSYDYVEMTIEEAITAADNTNVIVTGTVVKINTAYSSSYNNISVYIADENGTQLYLYRLTGDVTVGQIIKVKGAMGTHNSARQVTGGTYEAVGTHTCSTYTDATCIAAPTCIVCGAVNGDKTDHIFVNGVCYNYLNCYTAQTIVAGNNAVAFNQYATNNGAMLILAVPTAGYYKVSCADMALCLIFTDVIGGENTDFSTVGDGSWLVYAYGEAYLEAGYYWVGVTAAQSITEYVTYTINVCAHNGGAATCLAQAVCATCGSAYGEKADHVYGEDYVCTTEGCEAVDPNKPADPQPEEQPADPQPGQPDDSATDEPKEEPKLNFFQKIWQAILNFFKKLFGKKN